MYDVEVHLQLMTFPTMEVFVAIILDISEKILRAKSPLSDGEITKLMKQQKLNLEVASDIELLDLSLKYQPLRTKFEKG